jgi:hypothetical protein
MHRKKKAKIVDHSCRSERKEMNRVSMHRHSLEAFSALALSAAVNHAANATEPNFAICGVTSF